MLSTLVTQSVSNAVPLDPTITPAPIPADLAVELLRRQGISIDPISLANVLLTAFPQSLRELAATNIPQVSRILWSEFLDDNTPSWFAALPTDIQGYLSFQYGPSSLRLQTTATDLDQSMTTLSTSLSTEDSASVTSPLTSSSSITAAAESTSANDQEVSSLPVPPANENSGGLNLAQKIGIGLGVPLAVLIIVASIFACCVLARRCRRRRGRSREIEERAPTSAFVSSSHTAPSLEQTWAPLPVPQGFANRGRDRAYGNNPNDRELGADDISNANGFNSAPKYDEDGFASTASAGIGILPSARRSRGNSASRSQNSLSSVKESPLEFSHENTAAAVPAPPARRSRPPSMNGNGFNDAYVGYTNRRSIDANGTNSLSPLSPLNPTYHSHASDYHNTHPALRESPNMMSSALQKHQNSHFGIGLGSSPRKNGYTTIAAPGESCSGDNMNNPSSRFGGLDSSPNFYDGSLDGKQQPSFRQDSAAYENTDWPLSNRDSLRESTWELGSTKERRPLWNGRMYEGT